jgi:hypothetical protein
MNSANQQIFLSLVSPVYKAEAMVNELSRQINWDSFRIGPYPSNFFGQAKSSSFLTFQKIPNERNKAIGISLDTLGVHYFSIITKSYVSN